MKEEHIFRNYSSGEPSVRLYLKKCSQTSRWRGRVHVGAVMSPFLKRTFDCIQDLRYIYGRYVNWSVEKETDMWDSVEHCTNGTKINDNVYLLSSRFNIQLMKTGRMKGQAFVGLPSEAAAAQALKETNGYLLRGKTHCRGKIKLALNEQVVWVCMSTNNY